MENVKFTKFYNVNDDTYNVILTADKLTLKQLMAIEDVVQQQPKMSKEEARMTVEKVKAKYDGLKNNVKDADGNISLEDAAGILNSLSMDELSILAKFVMPTGEVMV